MLRTPFPIIGCLLVVALSILPGRAGAEENKGPFVMNDIQATVKVPPDWTMTRWSDWDFKAESKDKAVSVWVFMTPWQVDPTEETVQAWARMHTTKLEEMRALDVKTLSASVTTIAQRPTGVFDLSFKFEKSTQQGYYKAMVIPGAGKTIHISTVGNSRNTEKVRTALNWIVENLEITNPAEPVASLQGLVDVPKYKFAVTLPDGWRKPTLAETKQVEGLAIATGNDVVDPEKCMMAIRPLAEGDPDFMLVCNKKWYLEMVDEYSWAGVESVVFEKFFGGAGSDKISVDHAQKIPAGDHLGFIYSPKTGAKAVRIGIMPYDNGIVVGWGLAQASREVDFDKAYRSTITGLKFTGPDNGKAPVGLVNYVSYVMKYRRSSPLFIGPMGVLGLLVVGGLAMVFGRKKKPMVFPDYSSEPPVGGSPR